ncbi:putative histidine phosphatase superfamily [Helianthus debilis subsp. tardiflorus]
MNSGICEGIYPLHRSKTIHLVRHAQGVHNVLGEKDHSAYMSDELFDAHLTPLGWEQVRSPLYVIFF